MDGWHASAPSMSFSSHDGPPYSLMEYISLYRNYFDARRLGAMRTVGYQRSEYDLRFYEYRNTALELRSSAGATVAAEVRARGTACMGRQTRLLSNASKRWTISSGSFPSELLIALLRTNPFRQVCLRLSWIPVRTIS